MSASTLLVLILIFTSSSALSMEDEHQSGICGCPMEIRESFHEDRIPSKIVERVCHQVGITCGASLDRAPLSSVSNNYHAKKVDFFRCSNIWILDKIVSSTDWIIGCWIYQYIQGDSSRCSQEEHHGERWLRLQTKTSTNWKYKNSSLNYFL